METNKDNPSDSSAEVAALEQIIKDKRAEQGITEPHAQPLKLKLTELPPITPERQAKIDAERDEMERRELARQRQQRLSEFLASVGRLHEVCRLHNFECNTPQQRAVVAALQEYTDTLPERLDNCEGIVLFGPVGTGKDHLLVSVGGIAVQRYDKRVRLINAQEWFGEVRDAMDSNRAEKNLIGEMSWPDVLIISDPVPPTGSLGQHMATMLYRLVEKRDSRGKATWMTVNVKDDADADKQLGEPTWDRLCDRAWKLHCNWPSHRKPARKVNCP